MLGSSVDSITAFSHPAFPIFQKSVVQVIPSIPRTEFIHQRKGTQEIGLRTLLPVAVLDNIRAERLERNVLDIVVFHGIFDLG